MKLSDILHPACVLTKFSATDKVEAISVLVDLLAENKQIADPEAVRKAVLEREGTKSTAMGYGLALPHGKSRGCSKLTMALGTTSTPVDFGGTNGGLVNLIILLASPMDQVGPHIQAIAKISRLMLSEEVRNRLINAETPQDAYQVILEAD